MLKFKEVNPKYQSDHNDFLLCFSDTSCTCFSVSPCGYCTHPGNPLNLDEIDDAWINYEVRVVGRRRTKYLKKKGLYVTYDPFAAQFLYMKIISM